MIFDNQFYEGSKITSWFIEDSSIYLQFVNSSFKVCNGDDSLRFLDELEICLKKWKEDEFYHGNLVSLYNLDEQMICFDFKNIGDINLEKDEQVIFMELNEFITTARKKLDLTKHC